MTFSIRDELRFLLTIQIDPSVLKKLQGMDPHQRVVLEVGYEACHHAGYSKGKLMNKIGWSLSLVASSDFQVRTTSVGSTEMIRSSQQALLQGGVYLGSSSYLHCTQYHAVPKIHSPARHQGPFSAWCQK